MKLETIANASDNEVLEYINQLQKNHDRALNKKQKKIEELEYKLQHTISDQNYIIHQQITRKVIHAIHQQVTFLSGAIRLGKKSLSISKVLIILNDILKTI